MVSKSTGPAEAPGFERPMAAVLAERLAEPRRHLQAVTGPRQVGKTTMVQQVAEGLGIPFHFVSADEPALHNQVWLAQQWEVARALARHGKALLVLDEVQKTPGWSETVKRLWDEDTRARLPLRVVMLGSAPLLIQRGLTESLAGRFETLHVPHWSFQEMNKAFGFSLDDFVIYGGYPGAAALISNFDRWRRYVLESLVEPTISRDVLLLTRVDKPALLRQVFELGCRYSAQVLAYSKMLGQLHDAGNTTTVAHYLQLLSQAGMVTGLAKYSGRAVRQRASSPKLQVLNTALFTSAAATSVGDVQGDPAMHGRLVESAVGAHLANAAASGQCQLTYWREGDDEVDFVVRAGRALVALEVKSGRPRHGSSGAAAFAKAHRPTRMMLVGTEGIPLREFLSTPVPALLAAS